MHNYAICEGVGLVWCYLYERLIVLIHKGVGGILYSINPRISSPSREKIKKTKRAKPGLKWAKYESFVKEVLNGYIMNWKMQ